MKIEKKKKMQIYKEGYRHLNVLGDTEKPIAVADPTYAEAVKELEETDKRIEELLAEMSKQAKEATGYKDKK